MNSQVLAVTAVMVCLICPIAFGFLMPTGEVEAVGYTTESPINITESLNNDRIVVPVPYDSYLNNLFMVNASLGYWLPSGDLSPVPNNYPAISYTGESIMTPSSLDLTAYTYYANTYMASVSIPTSAEIYDSNGTRIYGAVYFPSTGLAYGVPYNNYVIPIEPVLSVTGGSIRLSQFHQDMIDGAKAYLDTSKGLYSAYGGAYWSNTQVNSSVNLIVETADLKLSAYSSNDYSPLQIYVGGFIDVKFEDGTSQRLGSSSSYTKLLIQFDTSTSKATVTGLLGMTEFTQNPNDHKGNSVSGDIDLENIRSIRFNESNVRYYVSSAMALNDNTSVMNNVNMDPDSFYPNSLWSTTMKNVGIFGSSIDFNVTSNGVTTTYSYSVVDGKATEVPLEASTTDVDLSDVSVALVPLSDGTGNVLRINGKVLDIGTLDSEDTVTITFDGIWKMNTTISKLTSYTYSYYEWTPGTFNIGSTTFCLIGFLAAMMMAIISGLCAFKYETGGLLPLFVSGIAGTIYLLMLFSYA